MGEVMTGLKKNCTLCGRWFAFVPNSVKVEFACALCGEMIENDQVPAKIHRVANRLNAYLLNRIFDGRGVPYAVSIYAYSDGSLDISVRQMLHYFRSFENAEDAESNVGTLFSRVKNSTGGDSTGGG